MDEDIASIANGWILEHSSPNIDLQNDDKKHLYYDKLADFISNDPKRAIDIVVTMLELTVDDAVISNIAAGPLEDLISRNGPALIDRIENEARQNRKLRYALRGVWKNLSDDSIWKRIERVRNLP